MTKYLISVGFVAMVMANPASAESVAPDVAPESEFYQMANEALQERDNHALTRVWDDSAYEEAFRRAARRALEEALAESVTASTN